MDKVSEVRQAFSECGIIFFFSGDPYFLMSNRQLMVGFFSSMVASQVQDQMFNL